MQRNHGRLPPRWHAVHVIGTRCSTDFHSASPPLRARYIKITASVSVRTLMLPEGFPSQVHDHEKCCPACSRPSRCQRRTSIERQDSQITRPAISHLPRIYRNHLENLRVFSCMHPAPPLDSLPHRHISRSSRLSPRPPGPSAGLRNGPFVFSSVQHRRGTDRRILSGRLLTGSP